MDIQNILKKVDQLFKQKKHDEVEPFLRFHLEQSLKENKRQTALSIYNELIGFYRSTGRHKESVDSSLKALVLCRDMKLNGTVPHATTLLNAATAYRAADRQEEALILFQQALSAYEANLDENDERIASLYNNMSLVFQDLKEYGEVLNCLEKALSIVKSLTGKEIETAITCTNIANVYFELKDYDKAISYLDQALPIYEKAGGTDPHYASALSAKAQGYYLMKDYGKAIDTYTLALKKILEHFGANDAYAVTCENCALVFDEAGYPDEAKDLRERAAKAREKTNYKPAPEPMESLKGLELSRKYYEIYGKQMIESNFSAHISKIAVGLAGQGSECFGFDDELSKDHDFGPSFCIWLTDEDYEAFGSELQDAYDKLPGEFMGHPARTISEHGRGRIGVLKISDFYKFFIGRTTAPESLREWLHLPEQNLAAAVNGKVFSDPLGLFSEIRNTLKHGYPEDVRIKKIAARAASMAQSGQYNYARCMLRGDVTAASLALNEFIRSTISMVYLLNNQYAPYYKWAAKGIGKLPVLSEIKNMLAQMTEAPFDKKLWKTATAYELNTLDIKITMVEDICNLIIEELNKQGLTDRNDDFLENHTQVIMSKIQDEAIRNLHVTEG